MKDRIKIVAIGDSNTDRYYINNVLGALCYTDFLERILQDVPPGDPVIINRGKAGETTIDMYARFRTDVIEEEQGLQIGILKKCAMQH